MIKSNKPAEQLKAQRALFINTIVQTTIKDTVLAAEVLFAFKIIEYTYHGAPTHNVNNCFNNTHNSDF